jgi:hypothetical protein
MAVGETLDLISKRNEVRSKYLDAEEHLRKEYDRLVKRKQEMEPVISELRITVSGSFGNSSGSCITEALDLYNSYQQRMTKEMMTYEEKSEKAISQLASMIQV